jgi:hypothetical protein
MNLRSHMTRFGSISRLALASLVLTLIGVSLSLRVQGASAAPPEGLTYQGFLADGNGVGLAPNNPINYSVEFRIYDAQTGGNVVWAEVQTVTVDRGQFSVVLGEGAAIGNELRPALSAVFASPTASDRFLDMTVTVGGNPLNITPRLRFLPSPYSFLASQANSLVGPSGATLLAADAQGNLSIAGSITSPGAISNQATTATSANTPNAIVARDAGGNFSAANVGLSGTMNGLNVNVQSVRASSFLGAHLEGAHLEWNHSLGLGETWLLNQRGSGIGGIAFGEVDAARGITERMRIAHDGRVGIGTATPDANLVVRAASGPGQISIDSPGGQASQLLLREAGVLRAAMSYLPTDATLRLYNNGIDAISVAASGRVGFGTNVPDGTLHVASTGNRGSGTAIFQATDLGGSASHIHHGANGDWYIRSALATGNVIIQDSGGRVGVGRNAPAGFFHVQSDSTNRGEGTAIFSVSGVPWSSHVYHGVNGDIYWRSAAAAGKIILQDTGGNVGIGHDNPTQARLVVSGVGTDTANLHSALLHTGVATSAAQSYTLNDVTIKASNGVHADFYRAISDARIKKIHGQSNSAEDLSLLGQIEITNYDYKDTVGRGSRPQKKVIGQQLEEVFPQAVARTTDVVPDIYQKADLVGAWVKLSTDLKVGERVRLVSSKADRVYEVLEVDDQGFRTSLESSDEPVFVYGREVDDFRVVDYEAVSMLNVSATQELAKKIKELEKSESRIAELEETVSQVKELQARASRVEKLEAEVSELKALVAQLIEANSRKSVVSLSGNRPAQN